MILSVFLYNAETWELTKPELEQARIWYHKLARLTIGKRRGMGEDGHWETNEIFLKNMGLDTILVLVYNRRVAWLGHLARRSETDEGAKNMLEKREGIWWDRMLHDLAIRGCSVDMILQNCNSKSMLLKEVISKDPQSFQ